VSGVLECRGVSVDYASVRALSGVNLIVGEGETLALLGPSGSGKTTLAHAIAGLVPLAEGEIVMNGEVVADRHGGSTPDRRQMGVVFQNYALWPHMNALDIVAYPLRRAGASRDRARKDAADLMERLGIGELGQRRPAQLSGGQQQRVGLARALARRADLYLFDEPTAHLDAAVRAVVQTEIGRARKEGAAAAVYSTHDAAEALAMADRVALLRDGALVQVGTPREVYEQPADEWSAQLTGPASVLSGLCDGSSVFVEGVPIDVGNSSHPEGAVDLLVRPDWVIPGGSLAGSINEVLFRGPHTDYRVESPVGEFMARLGGPPTMAAGTACGWTISRGWVLFPTANG
jgi:ABC-type Fe3+/spermidine/putrescine transport system ATPase subunit